MADVELTPSPFDSLPIDTEAQAVLTDFLDYTEYLPSDLIRSFTLIKTLDKQYHQHLDTIHLLTKRLATNATLPHGQRQNPQDLRRDISAIVDKAFRCRDCAYAEIKRLNETVAAHATRLTTIKTKLEALPKPPSRDPTPVPALISPVKSRKSEPPTPKLKLNLGEKKRGRKPLAAAVALEISGESLAVVSDGEQSRRTPKLKPGPRPTKPRFGSNAHSAVAGISTSNALAKLTPPPPDAQAGSKWRPWFKLTEYEMAKLRKMMKKNTQGAHKTKARFSLTRSATQ